MTTYGTAYRDSVIRPYLQGLAQQYGSQPGGIVPEPIAEGVIDVETGGTFDPTTYESSSGAIGLGQITTTGQEWADWVEANPGATADRLTDPEYNMDVMYYGLWKRHERAEEDAFAGRPAAQRDWYMATAGYLGGADENGFNGAADALGTTGPAYVKAIFNYIAATFGAKTATDIDKLQVGSAFADGYDHDPRFDPDADPDAESVPIPGSGVVTGALDKAAQEVIDYLQGQAGQLLHDTGPFLERAGLFIAGVLIAGFGTRLVFPPGGGK